MSLGFSLSGSLLTMVVQQWTRSYLRVYQRSKKPLKTARIQTFLSKGLELMPMMAEAAPGLFHVLLFFAELADAILNINTTVGVMSKGLELMPMMAETALWLIHVSVFLFFAGLADAILNIKTAVGVTTAVLIIICGFFYLYSEVTSLMDPQSSYRSPFSCLIWYFLRDRFHHTFPRMEARQEQHAMKHTEERVDRDVRAVQWLIDSIDGSNEMDTSVLAIPGSFNQESGSQVWKEVTVQGEFQPDVQEAQLTFHTDVHVPPRLDPSPYQEEPPLIISADACGTFSRATIPREIP